MKVEIKIIGETLREESAIELIHNAVSTTERGSAQGNTFYFFPGEGLSEPIHYRAWKIMKAISDILEIKP